MKKRINRYLKLLTVLLTVILSVYLLQTYVLRHWDHNSERIQQFYQEERDSLDVIFIGGSEIYTGYSAAQAYAEYGFTSYPFGVSSNQESLFCSEVTEALKYQSPKLIIIEITSFLKDSPDIDDAKMRNYLENIPMSMNRIKTTWEYEPSMDCISYLVPFIKYHGNWSDPGKCLDRAKRIVTFKYEKYSPIKGMRTIAQTVNSDGVNDMSDNRECNMLSTDGEHYLRQLLAWLKEEKIANVVFTRFPHRIDKEEENYEFLVKRFKRGNQAGAIIREYGFDYIDCEHLISEIGIDFNNDFYNADHMNIFGAQKTTAYLAKRISNDYGVGPSALNERQRASWDTCAAEIVDYYQYVQQKIAENTGEVIEERDWISMRQ